jgi:hypothetical protein
MIEAAAAACAAIEQVDHAHLQSLLPPLTRLLYCAESARELRIQVEAPDLCIEPVPASFLDRWPDEIAFYVLFSPLDSDSVVTITVKDCLGDIYAPLKGGLELLSRSPEKKLNVLWEWRNDYEFHWGRHLIDAIRYLLLSSS